jgi:putative SOS response-associated peptidase YedK
MRWGLLPPWAQADDRGLCARMINARSETVSEKPAFADSWRRRRRCLVPADGFYEWTDGGGGKRQPHFIHNNDGSVMAFAGLWARHGDLLTFTILTRDADGPAAALHHRLPVMIDPARAQDWFAADEAHARALVTQAGGARLTHHPVDPAVGKVSNDTPSLIDAYPSAA